MAALSPTRQTIQTSGGRGRSIIQAVVISDELRRSGVGWGGGGVKHRHMRGMRVKWGETGGRRTDPGEESKRTEGSCDSDPLYPGLTGSDPGGRTHGASSRSHYFVLLWSSLDKRRIWPLPSAADGSLRRVRSTLASLPLPHFLFYFEIWCFLPIWLCCCHVPPVSPSSCSSAVLPVSSWVVLSSWFPEISSRWTWWPWPFNQPVGAVACLLTSDPLTHCQEHVCPWQWSYIAWLWGHEIVSKCSLEVNYLNILSQKKRRTFFGQDVLNLTLEEYFQPSWWNISIIIK